MNFAQKLGLFILIAISAAYIYFSFFSTEGIHIPTLPSFNHEDENNSELPPAILDEITTTTPSEVPTETPHKHTVKSVKIFVTDSNGKIRSLNRKCDTAQEKSCFAYAMKELVSAPSNWEKSKGFTSEIPSGTKILTDLTVCFCGVSVGTSFGVVVVISSNIAGGNSELFSSS